VKFNVIRACDLLVSGLFILLVLPVWLIVIPILRFTGEGEVFYRQPRVGNDGRTFELL
jgi:lipopolysaccharide/colanic/teichoic acid biosynthesis glycosyltransferase